MKNKRKVFQTMSLIMQFGLNMIIPILICTMLGVWLDKKYDKPMITILLFIVGALAGFNSVYKIAKKIYGQDGKSDR